MNNPLWQFLGLEIEQSNLKGKPVNSGAHFSVLLRFSFRLSLWIWSILFNPLWQWRAHYLNPRNNCTIFFNSSNQINSCAILHREAVKCQRLDERILFNLLSPSFATRSWNISLSFFELAWWIYEARKWPNNALFSPSRNSWELGKRREHFGILHFINMISGDPYLRVHFLRKYRG